MKEKKKKSQKIEKKKFLINNHILMIKKCQSLCQNRGEKKYFQQ